MIISEEGFNPITLLTIVAEVDKIVLIKKLPKKSQDLLVGKERIIDLPVKNLFEEIVKKFVQLVEKCVKIVERFDQAVDKSDQAAEMERDK